MFNRKPIKVALFATGVVGQKVAEFLAGCGDFVAAVYVEDVESKYSTEIEVCANCGPERIFSHKLLSEPNHFTWLEGQEIDFIITVYWPYLLKPSVFELVKNSTVNFHPAPLPINRGWYPHVHSLIDGSPLGVTLHVIDEHADTGPIWCQRNVELLPTDTAIDIYRRLQTEIFQLFSENWAQISGGQIQPTRQTIGSGNYHKKSEVDDLDIIDLEVPISPGELIDKLRARSFGNKGFAYYLHNGEKIFLNLKLGKSSDFNDI